MQIWATLELFVAKILKRLIGSIIAEQVGYQPQKQILVNLLEEDFL